MAKVIMLKTALTTFQRGMFAYLRRFVRFSGEGSLRSLLFAVSNTVGFGLYVVL